MNEYETRPFPLVNNDYYLFREVAVNGKYLFSEFIRQLTSADRKHFEAIIAYMDMFSPQLLLPKTKFNHIESSVSTSFYEFKKNNLRVYVAKIRPNMFVLLGGYKSTQKRDIKSLNRLFTDFIKQYKNGND